MDDTETGPDDAAMAVIQIRRQAAPGIRITQTMQRAAGQIGTWIGRGMETGQTHRRPDLHLQHQQAEKDDQVGSLASESHTSKI